MTRFSKSQIHQKVIVTECPCCITSKPGIHRRKTPDIDHSTTLLDFRW